jgi:hypothetical protein
VTIPRRERGWLSKTLGLLIRLAVELRRLENGAAALASSPLSRAFTESLSLLSGEETISTGQARRFLTGFNTQIGDAITSARATATSQAIEIASYQSERTAKILSKAAGNVFTADGIDRDRLREILTHDSIEGRTADQWFRRLEAEIAQREQFKSHDRRAGLRFQSVDEWLRYSGEIVALCNSSHTRAF